MMTLSEIRNYCLALPGTTEDIKWINHLCFSIGGKMYLVTSPDAVPISITFKAEEQVFDTLPNEDGICLAPYMARNKWLLVDSIERFSKDQWQKYIDMSYGLVLAKLPAKTRKAISDSNL